MRIFLTALAGGLAIIVSSPVQAQQASPDRTAVEAAEEAANQAERAAVAAAEAMKAAAEAAKAARMAARAARAAYEGKPPEMARNDAPIGTAPPAASPPVIAAAMQELDPNGNVLVPGARAAPGGIVTVDKASVTAADRKLFARALAGSAANGPAESALRVPVQPDFQFSAAEKDKTGTVSVSFDISNTSSNILSTEALTLSASAKLNDSGEVDFGGLKGFSSGTTIELGYSNFWSKAPAFTGQERTQVTAARQNCMAKLKDAKACDPYKFQKGGVTAFVGKWNEDGVKPMLDEILPNNVNFWGLKVSANQTTFKNLDRTAFKENKDDRLGLAGTVYGGVLMNRAVASIGGSFTLKRSYKAGESITLCQPLASSVQTQCLTSQDGPPKRKVQAIVAVEGRRALAFGDDGMKLAIAPELSTDLNNDAWSLVVPVYFAGDGSGQLRAGVRGVYTNQKDAKNGGRDEDFAIGLFFGAPFSVFAH